MDIINLKLQELSLSEQKIYFGGVSPFWRWFGKWAAAKYYGMLDDIDDGVYCD